MAYALLYSLIATFAVSLLSLSGVFFLAFKDKTLSRIVLHLVGFAAGALVGGAFLHILPEAVELSDSLNVFIYVLVGIIVFFILERIIHWHHCHEMDCDVHTFTYMNLFGDGLHNFIDGLFVVSAFLISTTLGWVTALVIALHELPQEIGDFGVLIHGGFSKAKALFWNFVTALTAILGAVVGFFLAEGIQGFDVFLLPFAAGGFIYIAMSDLVPELHKEKNLSKAVTHFLFFLFGVVLMWAVKVFLGA